MYLHYKRVTLKHISQVQKSNKLLRNNEASLELCDKPWPIVSMAVSRIGRSSLSTFPRLVSSQVYIVYVTALCDIRYINVFLPTAFEFLNSTKSKITIFGDKHKSTLTFIEFVSLI